MDFEDFHKFAYLRYIALGITWDMLNKWADHFASSGSKMQFHNYIIEQGLYRLSMQSFLKTLYTDEEFMHALLVDGRDFRIWRADMHREEHRHD